MCFVHREHEGDPDWRHCQGEAGLWEPWHCHQRIYRELGSNPVESLMLGTGLEWGVRALVDGGTKLGPQPWLAPHPRVRGWTLRPAVPHLCRV